VMCNTQAAAAEGNNLTLYHQSDGENLSVTVDRQVTACIDTMQHSATRPESSASHTTNHCCVYNNPAAVPL
jgi:hypothetical protein